MKPQIIRPRADIACFARSGTAGQPRVLLALAELMTGPRSWPERRRPAPSRKTTSPGGGLPASSGRSWLATPPGSSLVCDSGRGNPVGFQVPEPAVTRAFACRHPCVFGRRGSHAGDRLHREHIPIYAAAPASSAESTAWSCGPTPRSPGDSPQSAQSNMPPALSWSGAGRPPRPLPPARHLCLCRHRRPTHPRQAPLTTIAR